MNLLSVGPSPLRSGGVAFYQRALNPEFIKKNIRPYYLGVDQVNHALRSSIIQPVDCSDDKFENNVFDLILCSGVYFGGVNPLEQISEVSAEKVFYDFLVANKINVVHFHASRPASLISTAKLAGCRVLVSLHDYWYLCSLGFLVDPNREQCNGSNGTRCSIVCDSFSRDREEYVSRNNLNALIRSIVKLLLRYFMGSKYSQIRKRLSRSTSGILPSVDGLKSTRPFSEHRNYKSIDWNIRQNGILEIINGSADLVISVSKIVTERHLSLGISSKKLVTINSGFEHADDDFFKKSREVKRPLKAKSLKLVFVSPLYPEKGLHVVLPAVTRLINENFDVELCVYGKMEEWSSNYWEPLLKDLPKKIKFHGTFDYKDLPKIYCNSDMAIVAPIMEDPSPRVVWEALSAGVPVIASKFSGAADFVFDGVNGLLFENSNVGDLYTKLKSVCEKNEKLSRYQNNISTLKTIKEHAKELIDLYENKTE